MSDRLEPDSDVAKLSVIIPAYNAERTLAVAVRSVLAQTFRRLRVIIVDDGSIDRTAKIADALAAEDARVRVIHQANAGGYTARLNALRQIKSEYFGFVDADDTIEPTMYQRLLEFAEKNDLDIAQCDYGTPACVKGETSKSEFFIGEDAIYRDVIRPRLIEGRDAVMVWDKLYRNWFDFSDFVQFPYTLNDDAILNFQFFRGAKRVGYLHEQLYHYAVNAGSSVRNYNNGCLENFEAAVKLRRELAARYGQEIPEKCLVAWVQRYARNIVILACASVRGTFRDRVRWVDEIFASEVVRDAMNSPLDTSQKKARMFLRLTQSGPSWMCVCILLILKRIQGLLLNRE